MVVIIFKCGIIKLIISNVAVNSFFLSEIEEKKIRINPGKSRIIEYDLGDVIGIEKLRLVGFDKISDFI
ncbi:MAG: hypothetical protein E7270_12205 [Lachnospiraceae bacterium]|nr:hypothetical protein [Lachnospiraceae bacterium]